MSSSRFVHSTSDSYDRFMGRYSAEIAPRFADLAGVTAPMTALDVGCGPGALTRELVRRLGAGAVSACDPSPGFVETCQARNPGVTVKAGPAEALPFADSVFDVTLAQLVLHFLNDPRLGISEMMRVTKSGGRIGGVVWDLTGGMELFRLVGEAAQAIGPISASYNRSVKFGGPGEIAEFFAAAGLVSIDERLLTVLVTYEDFDDLWTTLQSAAGPTATFMNALSPEELPRLREALHAILGNPPAAFTLEATARAVIGTRA